MTAVPLRPGVEPPLHSLVDQSNVNGVGDCETPKNEHNFMEMGRICCDDATTDFVNVKPTTFVTGPEVWPAHLQLKVKTSVNLLCPRP